MLFVAGPAYGAYRLFEVVSLGKMWDERRDRWISYSSDPSRFLLEIAASIAIVTVPALYLGARAKYPDWAQRIMDSIRPR
jgi:hypothetical protein